MYLQRSKTTLDSLKSVFNVFRKKSSLGAPADCFLAELAPGRVEWWGEGGGVGEIWRGRCYVFKFRYNDVFISSKYKTATVNWNVSVSNTDQMCSRLKVLFLLNKGADKFWY